MCNPGFAGADCSFPFMSCPDGIMQCFGTGAVCVPYSTREQELEEARQHPSNGGLAGDDDVPRYKCDCSGVPNTSPFQMAECENPESQVCEDGQSVSQYAFCTNGGTCVAQVRQGMPHAGCHCGNDFEGRHCQYRKGTAPKYELQLAYQEEKNNLSPIVKLWIALVCLGAFAVFALVVYRRHAKKNVPHAKFFDAAECGPAPYDPKNVSAIEVNMTDLAILDQAKIYSGSFVYNDDPAGTKGVDKTVDCSTDDEEEVDGFNGLQQPSATVEAEDDTMEVDKGEMA